MWTDRHAVLVATLLVVGALAASPRANADAFTPGTHGFLDIGGSFTQIDVPGASSTSASGINNAGQIVGYSSSGFPAAFLYTDGNFTEIDGPGANYQYANGINNAGQIVLTSYAVSGHVGHAQGLLDTGGNFTPIDVPGTIETSANGINNMGQIVGWSFNPTDKVHGFLDTSGSLTQIDVPGASSTLASGINDAGQIVGVTMVSGGTGDPHFTTYNGVHYDFQGIGDFLLARSTIAGDQFDVQIRTTAWPNGTSLIEGAAATLCGHQVTFDANRASAGASLVWVDNSPISLSVDGPAFNLGACKIFEPSSMQYQAVWDTGETLDIADYGTWLAVSSQLSSIDGPGSVEGLLATEVNPDAWRVTGTASLFDPVPEPTRACLQSQIQSRMKPMMIMVR